jgi:hypothetical protein
MRPYVTVALMRSMADSQPGQATETEVVSLVDDSRTTVIGSGLSAQAPMFCPDMESQVLPQCRCHEDAGQESVSAAGNADGTE